MIIGRRALLSAGFLFTAAIAGFYYAYWCSVMIGLDSLPPDRAIAAMQGINAHVRNPRFAPAFFAPAPVLLIGGVLCWLSDARRAAGWSLASALVIAVAVSITVTFNVPLNNSLAEVVVGSGEPSVAWSSRWQAYETPWSVWNGVRMAISFVALVCAGLAFRCEALEDRRGTG